MRTNAVTMNVKEVARHFAEWGAEQVARDVHDELDLADREV